MRPDSLEARLRDHPGDDAAWLAYRDRLRGEDDPRAPLVDLVIRAGDRSLVPERARLQRQLEAALGLSAEHGILGHFHAALYRVSDVRGDLLANLRHLAALPFVDARRLEPHAADDAAIAAPLARLAPTCLRLRDCRLGEAGFTALAAVNLPLVELGVWPEEDGQPTPAALLQLLAMSPTIEQLALFDADLGDAGVATLIAAGLPLTRLSLCFEERLGEAGLAGLAQLPLAGLGLFDCELPRDALATLLHAPIAASLTSLGLSGTRAGPGLWAALAAGGLPELACLDADGSDFGDAEAVALAAGGPRRLTRLDLTYTKLAHATVNALLDAFPSLHLAADLRVPDADFVRGLGERFFLGRAEDGGSSDGERSRRWLGNW